MTRFDITALQSRADPHPLLHQMREQAPVYGHPIRGTDRRAWYLTRYADVRQALRDPRLGRQLDRLPPGLADSYRARAADPLAGLRRNVFHTDPPDHTRLRRLISPLFSLRAVTALGEHVTRIVGQLVSELPVVGEVDMIRALALPLPLMVVAQMVGIPDGDIPRLRQWSDEITAGQSLARARRAGDEIASYLDAAAASQRAGSSAGLLSLLAAAEDRGEITRPELLSTAFQMLLAGDETTVNLIGNAILELLRHPDQLARLRAQPDLIGPAVEEAARFNGPVGHSGTLYAMEDAQIGGTVIPWGDTVVPVLLAANRDPAAFPAPDAFDIGRSPNQHLGFGAGIHFCPGAALARMQARAAISALVRRYSRLTLAVDADDLPWIPGLFLHGVRRLPVQVEA